MEPIQHATVYIVDDDASVRDALAWLLRTRRLLSESFDSAEAFDARVSQGFEVQSPSCVLLDVRMAGLSGLAMFEKLIAYGLLPTLPVIFLTGHADVPTAVDSVKRGAFDFFEKPFSDNALVDRIEQALKHSAAALALRSQTISLRAQLDGLTERESDVMRLVVGGLPNKLVADQLDISVRTVEVHRARVFDKMGVKSAVELANLLRNL
ncbi:two component transcriptional regulator, LuxR family [Polaromonas sp. OV174]|uniref:response regulator transcription factor n=1 Tax=Polaromonas sp. OV174 TaxID=1855300 RepID=UPI0008F43AD3|nr:response regulator [Polaromonas sp. OV174]SFC30021.1 two component transcriptional regulator, LuxR family [Polaromonas sp. OV174]